MLPLSDTARGFTFTGIDGLSEGKHSFVKMQMQLILREKNIINHQ